MYELRPIARALTIVLLLGVGSGAIRPSAGADESAGERSPWLVMLYLCGDHGGRCIPNDPLEKDAVAAINAMLDARIPDNLRIVALFDRAEGGNEDEVRGVGTWHGARILELRGKSARVVSEIGPANLGDPDTLARFLRTARGLGSFCHQGLLFKSHGKGWSDLCRDDGGRSCDSLRLDEAVQALTCVLAPKERLDFIAFDACEIARVEVAYALAPYARIFVASEGDTEASAWPYAAAMEIFRPRQPTPESVCMGTAQAYAGSTQGACDRILAKGDADIAAVRLEAMPGLATELQAFVTAFRARLDGPLGPEVAEEFLRARKASAHFSNDCQGAADYDCEAYDLVDLFRHLGAATTDARTVAACNAVSTRALESVMCELSEPGMPAFGLCLYANLEPSDYEDFVPAFAKATSWAPLLARIRELVHTIQPPSIRRLRCSLTTDFGRSTVSVHAVLSADRRPPLGEWLLVQAETDDTEATITTLGVLPFAERNGNDVRSSWDGRWPTLKDSSGSWACVPVLSTRWIDEAHSIFEMTTSLLAKEDGAEHPTPILARIEMKADADGWNASFTGAVNRGDARVVSVWRPTRPFSLVPNFSERKALETPPSARRTLSLRSGGPPHFDAPQQVRVEVRVLEGAGASSGHAHVGVRVRALSGELVDAVEDVELPPP